MTAQMSEDYKKLIGQALFNGRKRKSLSRAALGNMAGLHESTIKRYEDGKIKNINLDKINEIAKLLNIDLQKVLLWNELDQLSDVEKLSNEVFSIEIFDSFLESLGYSVKSPLTTALSFNPEESKKLTKEAAKSKDAPFRKIFKEDEKPIYFTVSEYEQFRESIKKALEYELFKFQTK